MEADPTTEAPQPGFLIAPPTLQDPNFKEAVVIICVQESEGAMGFVLNRPAGLQLHSIRNIPTSLHRLILQIQDLFC